LIPKDLCACGWRRGGRSGIGATRKFAWDRGIAEIWLLGSVGGVWLILMGWFLFTAARAEETQAIVTRDLAGVTVRAVMTPNPITVSAEATVPAARARVAFGSGVVVDASAAAGTAPRARAALRYRSAGARVTLKPMRWGGYRVRVVVSRADLGAGAPAFVSASVQVGDRSFASALACTAGRGGRFGCRE